MTNNILNVYTMIGESKDGQKYQVELVCEDGTQKQTYIAHIEKIGWTHYGYELSSYYSPESIHINLRFEE